MTFLTLSRDATPEDKKDICYFSSTGNVEKLTSLLQKDKKLVNFKDDEGLAGSFSIIFFLIELLAIHYACDRGNVKILEVLLSFGADVNLQDDTKQTPLHYAVLTDNIGVASLLLQKGANASIQDEDGNTPKDIAESDAMKKVLPNE